MGRGGWGHVLQPGVEGPQLDTQRYFDTMNLAVFPATCGQTVTQTAAETSITQLFLR